MRRTAHAVLGTKAQYLKMIPVIKQLCEMGCRVRVLDTCQHGSLCDRIASLPWADEQRTFLLRRDLATSRQTSFIIWLLLALAAVVRLRLSGRARAGVGTGDVVLVHGDTASTVVGLFFGKLFGLKVLHIESGLTSGNLCDPLPEELFRRICLRWSDVCYTPDHTSYTFARDRWPNKEIVHTYGNTILDTLVRVSVDGQAVEWTRMPYAVVTCHRYETVRSRLMLVRLLDCLDAMTRKLRVLFILHPVTERGLAKARLLQRLRGNSAVEVRPLVPHEQFVGLMQYCEFIATDGGSIQEEAAAMGVPCLILRRRTERCDGLGGSSVLSGLDIQAVGAFVQTYEQYDRRERVSPVGRSPSRIIADDVVSRLGYSPAQNRERVG